MHRISRFSLLFTGLFLFATANADWIEDSDVNAMLVLSSQASFQPEAVASSGLSEFDGDVFDINANYLERQDANDRELLTELQRRLVAEEHPKVRQDLEILIQSINDEIETRRIGHEYMLPYFDMHGIMFGSFRALLDPRNDKERYVKALDRLRKYNGSEDGFTPATELAKARTSERFEVAGLLGPYRGELETDISNAPRYVAGVRDLFENAELVGWEEEFAKLEFQLADYAEWLTEGNSAKSPS